MSQQNTTHPPPKTGTRRDRRVKLGFLAVLLVVGAVVWLIQRRPPAALTKGWPDDLDKALAQAGSENRPILAFFTGQPLSATARWLLRGTLARPENKKAIAKGRFIKVRVALDRSLTSELAQRYQIKSLPTMLVLEPDGKERNRRTGRIGEVSFRNDFLSGKDVQKPS